MLEVHGTVRQREHLADRVLAALPHVAFIYEVLDDRVSFCNASVRTVLGYDAEQITGKSLFNSLLPAPEDAGCLQQKIAELSYAPGTEKVELETRLRHADGSWWPVHLQCLAFERDAERRVIEVLCIASDISGRRPAERKMKDLQRLLQLAVDTMPQRVFWKDLNSRYLGCNQAFANDVGCGRPEEIVGKDDCDLTVRDFAHAYQADDRAVMASGIPRIGYEEKMPLPDGSFGWLRTSKIPLRDDAGAVVGILGTYEDITERKRGEEALRRAMEAAEATARFKTDFLANMSHEIRTPLNGVLGMVALLLDSPLSADQRYYAQTAQTSGETLLSLLNDVLDLSKAESGKLTLEHAPFNLGQTIAECVELLRPQAGRKGLTMIMDWSGALPTAVFGDPARVRQILLNYLGNAVKFTMEGGVRIEARVSHVSSDSVRVRISVRDTGVGIAKESQPQLFQPFTQADGSTTRRFGGTGLGLSIARQMAQLMDGTVGLESEPGRGSTFWVDLPFMIANESELSLRSVSRKEPTAPARAWRVLVAEDNPVNQLVTRRFLERLGCAVELADDGPAALKAWRDGGPYDVLLMDCQMPGLDGYETAAAIRREERDRTLARTPIIALTAHALTGDRERCLAVGMDDYLSKPLSHDALRNTLERWVAVRDFR